MAEDYPVHTPVLADEAVDALVWRADGFYVDGTLGEGGHAERICRRLSGAGHLLGIDRDPAAHRSATGRLQPFAERLTLVLTSFANLDEALEGAGSPFLSGALFDLGVSSRQIDQPERGFSYRFDGPLDMRMGPDSTVTAEMIVNSSSERELTRVFREYGEEPHAFAIARSIVHARENEPIRSTSELAEIVGRRGRERQEKVLSRVFQALRIAVNGELDALTHALDTVAERLEQGGRVVVIAYHSLEDRIVKTWMRSESTGCICPPNVPECRCGHVARLRLLTRRIVTPSPEEIAGNPRARSARMRVAERL